MQCEWLLITLLSLLLSMKVLSHQLNQCSNDEFDCENNQCIYKSRRCDGEPDCANKADETNCENCSRTDCSQGCRVKFGHEQCVCEPGFYLGEDKKTCYDTDKCAVDGWCSQKCDNSNGSFECSCKKGYELQSNNRTCMVPPDVEPLLLYSHDSSIRAMYLKPTGDGTRHNSSRSYHVAQTEGPVCGMYVNSKTSKIFWTICYRPPIIYSAHIAEGHNSSREAVVMFNLSMIVDIAHDWVTDNIYIADFALGEIIVCTADGSVCSVLHNKVNGPQHVTLDLPNGHIYWAVADGIFRSGMDGSDVTRIVNLSWVLSFTHDPSTSRLYWVNGYSGYLEYYDIESGKRGTNNISLPFLERIAVFEDNFFWVDPETSSVNSLNKFSGRNRTVISRGDGGFFINHPSLYVESIVNPCEGEPCSHMCLLAPGNSYKCACPYHMVLAGDRKTCRLKSDTLLLVSQKHSICKIYLLFIGEGVDEEVQLPRNFTITDSTFDPDSNTLYIFECEAKCSIFECDLTRQTCETIAQPPTKSVRGFTFDRMTKNLLWVDSVLGHLEVFSTATRTWRTLIDKGLERPVDLALNYRDRVIYIANLGSEPSILQANMDGTQQLKLIKGSDVGLPISVTYSADENKLHWADAENNVIKSMNVSDKNAVLGFYAPQNTTNIMSLGVVGNIYFFTDKDTPSVFSSERLSSGRDSISIPPQREKSVKKIQVYEIYRAGSRACGRKNGGCSHICLPTQTGRICTCASTYFRDPHNYNRCLPTSKCKANESQCLDGVNCYQTLFACDGQKDCPDGSDELDCSL